MPRDTLMRAVDAAFDAFKRGEITMEQLRERLHVSITSAVEKYLRSAANDATVTDDKTDKE